MPDLLNQSRRNDKNSSSSSSSSDGDLFKTNQQKNILPHVRLTMFAGVLSSLSLLWSSSSCSLCFSELDKLVRFKATEPTVPFFESTDSPLPAPTPTATGPVPVFWPPVCFHFFDELLSKFSPSPLSFPHSSPTTDPPHSISPTPPVLPRAVPPPPRAARAEPSAVSFLVLSVSEDPLIDFDFQHHFFMRNPKQREAFYEREWRGRGGVIIKSYFLIYLVLRTYAWWSVSIGVACFCLIKCF